MASVRGLWFFLFFLCDGGGDLGAGLGGGGVVDKDPSLTPAFS